MNIGAVKKKKVSECVNGELLGFGQSQVIEQEVLMGHPAKEVLSISH